MATSLNGKNICLMLLVGLPGSGKTYLTNFLANHFTVNVFKSEKYFTNLGVVPISYDDYICYNEQSDLIDWKQKRKNIFNAIEEFVLYFKGIKKVLTNKLFNNCIYENKNYILIIIDDNMYYKSMRYEYFQLARKYEISFCQIVLETTLEKAFEYNSRRDSFRIVPESVIAKMYNLIEIPNFNNSWEQNSLITPAFIDFQDSFILDKIYNIIRAALDSPITLMNNLECQDQSRKVTNSNLIHQLDIKLRTLIGIYLNQLNSNGQDVRCKAKIFNNNRLKLIKDVKSGLLVLPSEVIGALTSCSTTNRDHDFMTNYFINFITDKNLS